MWRDSFKGTAEKQTRQEPTFEIIKYNDNEKIDNYDNDYNKNDSKNNNNDVNNRNSRKTNKARTKIEI